MPTRIHNPTTAAIISGGDVTRVIKAPDQEWKRTCGDRQGEAAMA